MAKFRFRLATLLKIREATRDEKRTRLAEAYLAEETLKERKIELAEQVEAARRQHHNVAQPGLVNLDQLVETHRYGVVLDAQGQVLENQMKLLGEEIERRREVLVAADREVRILEKLREKQHKRHRKEAMKQEIKELDEAAGQKVRRSKV